MLVGAVSSVRAHQQCSFNNVLGFESTLPVLQTQWHAMLTRTVGTLQPVTADYIAHAGVCRCSSG